MGSQENTSAKVKNLQINFKEATMNDVSFNKELHNNSMHDDKPSAVTLECCLFLFIYLCTSMPSVKSLVLLGTCGSPQNMTCVDCCHIFAPLQNHCVNRLTKK